MSRSNGMVEREVGSIKSMFSKCKADNSDPYIALLMYRNTPKHTGYSPAQLCMSRKLRTKLPTSDTTLTPNTVDTSKVEKKIKKQQLKTAFYYNRNTKTLPTLDIGDKIYFKHKPNSTWVPGIISEKDSLPRSYIITSPQGSFRRNREHILKPTSTSPPLTVAVPENENAIETN